MTASTLSTADLIAIAAKCGSDAMSPALAELLPRLTHRLVDTDARAVAAERLLNIIWNSLTPMSRAKLRDDSPVVRAWIDSRLEGEARERRLAELRSNVAHHREAMQKAERELAALTPASAASPGPG